MSLMVCTSNCIYEEEGSCLLERATSPGEAGASGEMCVYFVGKSSSKKGKEARRHTFENYKDAP